MLSVVKGDQRCLDLTIYDTLVNNVASTRFGRKNWLGQSFPSAVVRILKGNVRHRDCWVLVWKHWKIGVYDSETTQICMCVLPFLLDEFLRTWSTFSGRIAEIWFDVLGIGRGRPRRLQASPGRVGALFEATRGLIPISAWRVESVMIIHSYHCITMNCHPAHWIDNVSIIIGPSSLDF